MMEQPATGFQVESVHSICVSAISFLAPSFAILAGAFLTERAEFNGYHNEFLADRAVTTTVINPHHGRMQAAFCPDSAWFALGAGAVRKVLWF